MKADKKELLAILQRIRDLPILVIGDLMLDRYIFGTVERISPEAPVPVVHVKATEDRLGGAGNAVRNLCSLAAKVSVCGYIGDDHESAEIRKLLAESKVDHSGILIDRSLPTTLKTRVIAQKQQVVRIDREEPPSVKAPRSPELEQKFIDLVRRGLENNKAVIFSDYGKGVLTAALIDLIEDARREGKIKLGVRPLVVDPHPSNYSRYKGMSVAKPNRKEAEVAAGMPIDSREAASKAARILLEKWHADMMLISLGEDGLIISVAGQAEDIFIDTVAQDVADVSGAGDAVTAVFTAAIAAGATPYNAGYLANLAAGIVVSEVGTVPVDYNKLIKAIEQL